MKTYSVNRLHCWELYYILNDYCNNIAAYTEDLEMQQKLGNADAVIVLFDKTLNKMQNENAFQIISDYIYNDNDEREPKEFLFSLMKNDK